MKIMKFLVRMFIVVVLMMVVVITPVAAQSPGVGVAEAAIGESVMPETSLAEVLDLTGFIKTAAVGAVPLIFVVLGLVSYFKKHGVKGNTLLLISMAIGLVFGGGYMITQHRPPVISDWFPVFVYWFEVAIFGIAMGLVASGVYDVAKGMIDKLLSTLKPAPQ